MRQITETCSSRIISFGAFVPDTVAFDLQFRLRCSHCNRRSGFRITIFDSRTRGDNSKPRLERVVVAGEYFGFFFAPWDGREKCPHLAVGAETAMYNVRDRQYSTLL